MSTNSTSERRRQAARLLEALVRERYTELVRVAAYYLHDSDDAEDAVQSACASFVSAFDPESDFGTDCVYGYLRRAVIGHALKLNRRRMRKPTTELGPGHEPTMPGIEELLADAEPPGELVAALAGLPEQERQALAMRILGFEPTEIADVLGISRRSYRKRIERAGRALREASQRS